MAPWIRLSGKKITLTSRNTDNHQNRGRTFLKRFSHLPFSSQWMPRYVSFDLISKMQLNLPCRFKWGAECEGLIVAYTNNSILRPKKSSCKKWKPQRRTLSHWIPWCKNFDLKHVFGRWIGLAVFLRFSLVREEINSSGSQMGSRPVSFEIRCRRNFPLAFMETRSPQFLLKKKLVEWARNTKFPTIYDCDY